MKPANQRLTGSPRRLLAHVGVALVFAVLLVICFLIGALVSPRRGAGSGGWYEP